MSRTKRKVADLLDEDPDLEDALAVVARVSEENGGVSWGDVDGQVTSGQWGRLIQEGVVVSDDEGAFELADPDAVEAALSEDVKLVAETTVDDGDGDGGDFDEIETQGWSKYDKAAGVGVLLVMAGYYLDPVQQAVGGTIDALLGPVDAVLPFYAVILVLATLTGVYSTLLQANLMNTELMGAYQERASALNERRKKAKERGDDEALDKIRDEQMDMMGDQMGMFKEQFRPMVWITLITIPVFLWMYWKVQNGLIADPENVVVMPMLGEVTWRQGVVGPMQAWIVWYFLCSMGFTQLIRKALNIQTAPTG